jgi:hypothetical protein
MIKMGRAAKYYKGRDRMFRAGHLAGRHRLRRIRLYRQ